jgi:hypothetical protein
MSFLDKMRPQEEELSETRLDLTLTAALGYAILNEQEKLLKARRDKVFRPIIESATDLYGIEDTNGHRHLVMDGAEVVRTKKVTATLNSAAAEVLLKELGIYDTCVQVVMSYEIDEEKLVEAYEAGLISAVEFDGLFTEKVSWATSVNSDNEEIQEIKRVRKEIEKGTSEGEMIEISNL